MQYKNINLLFTRQQIPHLVDQQRDSVQANRIVVQLPPFFSTNIGAGSSRRTVVENVLSFGVCHSPYFWKRGEKYVRSSSPYFFHQLCRQSALVQSCDVRVDAQWTCFASPEYCSLHFFYLISKRERIFQYTPPSDNTPLQAKKARKAQKTKMGQLQKGASEGLFMSGLLRD